MIKSFIEIQRLFLVTTTNMTNICIILYVVVVVVHCMVAGFSAEPYVTWKSVVLVLCKVLTVLQELCQRIFRKHTITIAEI